WVMPRSQPRLPQLCLKPKQLRATQTLVRGVWGSEDPTKRGTKYFLRRIAEENALGGGSPPVETWG
ncbi:MAG: hypothetical protein NW220_07435, partial [Leptolyngbyaceae cyanobacterium bins.349]|nr:hypothetical protein [Leptolyngbyaceae cyanobacterium bins.349]